MVHLLVHRTVAISIHPYLRILPVVDDARVADGPPACLMNGSVHARSDLL
jgi:hypothetical protein